MGALVSRVDPGSVAARYGIIRGDDIITINGQLLRDILDYYFVTSEHKLEINYLRNGFPRTTVIHKRAEEPLGLDFNEEVFDGIIPCRNHCVFCFVDQLPRDVRKSLCVKDDDYRLSFLHGNYITLTNLAETDLRRITALRLSPLYVSVHTTDPDVRANMMGNPQAANILKMLNKLKLHNIQCHTQVVVVPGINDGNTLKKTLGDLLNLYPTVKTVAIVPVGLTGHRQDRGAEKIRPFSRKDAHQVHDIVTSFQEKAKKRIRFPFFYMADEIYLLMGKDFPPHKEYGYFDQLGNGVGLSRKLYTDFNRRKRYLPPEINQSRNVWVVTGVLGELVLKPLMEHFKNIKRLKVRLIPIKNKFLGSPTTVTGLIAGRDIIEQLNSRLKRSSKPDLVLLPDVVLREGQFIDDISIGQIEDELELPVKDVPADAQGLIEGILGEWKKPVSRKKTRIEEEAKNHLESQEIPLQDVENAPEATKAKPLRPTGADREPKADWSKDYRPGMNSRRSRRVSSKPTRQRNAPPRRKKEDQADKASSQKNETKKEPQDNKPRSSRSRRSRGSSSKTLVASSQRDTPGVVASSQPQESPPVTKDQQGENQQKPQGQSRSSRSRRSRGSRSRGSSSKTQATSSQGDTPGVVASSQPQESHLVTKDPQGGENQQKPQGQSRPSRPRRSRGFRGRNSSNRNNNENTSKDGSDHQQSPAVENPAGKTGGN